MWFILIFLAVGISATSGSCIGSDCHLKRTTDKYPLWMRGFPKPVVTLSPAKETIVIKGHTCVLKCIADSPNDSQVNFNWKKDGRKLNLELSKNHVSTSSVKKNVPSSNLTEVIEHTQALYLVDIEDGDQGEYKCIVNNTHGSSSSRKVRVLVQVAPTFFRLPINVTVKAGATIKLECAANGQPSPQISWTKDGGSEFPAAIERRMHVMPQDHTYFIVESKIEDMGVYSCRAKNSASEIVANASVTILQHPQFLRPMTDKKATIGDTVRLECIANASPKPVLSWTRNDEPLVMTERHFLTADSQLLIIVKTVEEDAGVYSCQISNDLGFVKESMVLKVKSPHSIFHFLVLDWLLLVTILMVIVCLCVGGFIVCMWLSSNNMYSTSKDEGEKKDVIEGQTDIPMTPDVAFQGSPQKYLSQILR